MQLRWHRLVFLLPAFAAVSFGQTLPENASSQAVFLWRVLPEPLVPLAEDSAEDRLSLVRALNHFSSRAEPDDFSALEGFLKENPSSPWSLAVTANLGLFQYRNGYYSRCIDSYRAAWQLGKQSTEPKAKALADLAGGEYVKMLSRIGRMDDIRAYLKEVQDRTFQGPATELVSAARQGLATMEQRPEISFRCGPLALSSILTSQGKTDLAVQTRELESTVKGTSMAQVAELSRKLGVAFQSARRSPGAKVVCPSIVHWKVGHFAALLDEEAGRYHAKDPTFENDTWLTRRCLDEEASGGFLIPEGPLPEGWQPMTDAEAAEVFGKGVTSSNDPDRTGDGDHKTGGGGPGGPGPNCNSGMAGYRFHTLAVSLHIEDTPVGYRPPYGQPVYFTATYNQRESGQPANFTYSNLGQKWTHNWLSYVTDDPAVPSSLSLATAGGGTQRFGGYNSTTMSFAPQAATQAVMRRVTTSPVAYELEYSDGSKERFAASDGSTSAPRKVFLTERLDPFGNVVTLSYDAPGKLTGITDAIGQVTTISYEAADPYLITKVTDPFGRFASFGYNPAGRLISIRDVLGLESQLAYSGTSDFIGTLTTPYGTTTFTTTESGTTRRLTATDPLNQTEVLEFSQDSSLQPGSLPDNMLPAGMNLFNNYLHGRNSYFWSKKAWAEAPGDYSAAYVYHWLHGPNSVMATSPLESEKPALSARIWYNYPGQGWAGQVGSSETPTKIGLRLTNGTTRLDQYEYNSLGRVTAYTDPVGRKTLYSYAANQQDLLTVSMQGGGVLASYTYNAQHLPLTVTDAAGKTTTYTYDAKGQTTSVTDAKSQTTTYSYHADNAAGKQRKGRLASIDGPLPGNADTATFDYDAIGRVASITGPDGYVLNYQYDVFDRIKQVTYPDGSTQESNYDRLHPSSVKDRLGRVTTMVYNSLRQLTSVTDPAGRQVKYEWCRCGDLKALIDAMGRTTSWKHDVQGRVLSKKYPDGSNEAYGYDAATSAMTSMIDAKGQEKRYSYNLDNTLAGISYRNALIATPGVTFTYDPVYPRMTGMTDGIGTTNYSYHPVTADTLGAGRLADVDGPWANDVISYGYDELGRVVQRGLGGVMESVAFDAAGRATSVGNQLGAFSYTYDGVTARPLSVTHEGGQKTEYSYLPAAQDFRLQRIRNLHPDGSTPLSVFDYTYDTAGRIESWKQQVGIAADQAVTWTFGNDQADRLLSAVGTRGGVPIQNFGWTYDPAGNRLTETVDGATTTSSYNALNELVSTTASLPSLQYEWDAEDRLVAINKGANRTEFSYDGLGRRVRVVEKQNGTVVSNQCYLWDGVSIREQRDASGTIPQQRYFGRGYADLTGPTPQAFLQTTDHLGSIRDTTDTAGNLRQRVSYDFWGNPAFATGLATSPFAFTGHFWHGPSGLHLAPYRAYSSATGRWISRDPIKEKGGINLYSYVSNSPINFIDFLGLWRVEIDSPGPDCNCHSYAWHDCKGDPSDDFLSHTGDSGAPPLLWDNSNRNEVNNSDRLWTPDQPMTPNPRIGDILDYGNGKHSGVYTGPGEVTSKWGKGPVYQHSPNDVPGIYGPITGIYRKRIP